MVSMYLHYTYLKERAFWKVIAVKQNDFDEEMSMLSISGWMWLDLASAWQYSVVFFAYCIMPFTKERHVIFVVYTVREKSIWSPADFVRLPTDKEMISL